MDDDDGDGPELLWFWESVCLRGCSYHFTRATPDPDPAWPRACPLDGTALAMIGAENR